MTEESTEENITGDWFTMLEHYLPIYRQTPCVFLSVYLSACSFANLFHIFLFVRCLFGLLLYVVDLSFGLSGKCLVADFFVS